MKTEFAAFAVAMVIGSFSSTALADTQWHRGEVTRIWQHGEQGEFSVALTPAVEGCPDQLIEFSGDHFPQADARNQALSVALSALHSRVPIGIEVASGARTAKGHCQAVSVDIRVPESP